MNPTDVTETVGKLRYYQRKLSEVKKTLGPASSETEAIHALQSALVMLGFDPDRKWRRFGLTDVYGASTCHAVAEFAKRHGRETKKVTPALAKKVEGRFDALLTALERTQVELEDFTEVHSGSTDAERIECVQTLLEAVGESVRPDGEYRDATRAAVGSYAKRRELREVSGESVTEEIVSCLVDQLIRRAHRLWNEAEAQSPRPGVEEAGSAATDTAAVAQPGESSLAIETPVVTGRLLGIRPIGQKLENWCWAASTQMIVAYLRRFDPKPCPNCGRRSHFEVEVSQATQANRRLQGTTVDCRRVEAGEGTEVEYQACDRGGWPYFFEYEESAASTEWGARRYVLEERGLVLVDGGRRVRLRHKPSARELLDLTYNSGPEFKRRLDDEEGCALSWEKLTELLDEERPVAFAFRFPARQAGHMRVAAGYAVTPGDRKWVAVYDPLPPETGEIHFIPYEYYVRGPFGGHWRDYWIPGATTSDTPRSKAAEEFRVGKELAACVMDYEAWSKKGERKKRLATESERGLTASDVDAALPEAEAGLVAIRALAEHAPEVMVRMGMGGEFMRRLGGRVTSGPIDIDFTPPPVTEIDFTPPPVTLEVAPPPPIHVANLVGASDPFDPSLREAPKIPPEDLILDRDHPIPVYELSKKDLENWDEQSVWDLLDRPRQIIWEVEIADWEPFPFFAAVTVRRDGDEWKLASLGRAHLMSAIVKAQLEQITPMVASYQGTLQAATVGGAGLRAGHLGEEDIRLEASKLGYTDEETDAFFREGRSLVDTEKLMERVAVLDLTPAEVRAAAKDENLDSTKVEGYLLPRDGRLQSRAGETLSDLEIRRLKAWSDEHGRTKRFRAANIKFILNVRELYQLFAAYEDDRLRSLYPRSFHRPGKRVAPGTARDVLESLKKIAQVLPV